MSADSWDYLALRFRLREAVSVTLRRLRLYRWQGWWDAGTDALGANRRWWCRIGLHFWRRSVSDMTGRSIFVCRSCGVVGVTP